MEFYKTLRLDKNLEDNYLFITVDISGYEFNLPLDHFAELTSLPNQGICFYSDAWSLDQLERTIEQIHPYNSTLPYVEDIHNRIHRRMIACDVSWVLAAKTGFWPFFRPLRIHGYPMPEIRAWFSSSETNSPNYKRKTAKISVKTPTYVNLESSSEEHQHERTPSSPPRRKSLLPPHKPSKSTPSRSTYQTTSSSPSEFPTPTHVAPPPKL
ncbi:hypothetical protein Tco_0083505 [Tanacetum coccineum]